MIFFNGSVNRINLLYFLSFSLVTVFSYFNFSLFGGAYNKEVVNSLLILFATYSLTSVWFYNFLGIMLSVAFVAFFYIPFTTYDPLFHRPFPGYIRDELLASFCIFICGVFFSVLSPSFVRRKVVFSLGDFHPDSFRLLKKLSLFCFFIAVLNYIYYSISSGSFFSLFNLFDYRASREGGAVSGGALVGFGLKLFAPAAAFAIFYLIFKSSKTSERISLWFVIVFSVLFTLATGTRQNIVSILMFSFFSLMLRFLFVSDFNTGRTAFRKYPVSYIAAPIVAIFVLASAMRFFRGGGEASLEVISLILYYDTFDSMVFVVGHTFDKGFEYFYSIKSLMVNYIPRGLWEDKPVNFGRLVAMWAWGDGLDTGASYGPLFTGEFYANGGVTMLFFSSIFLFFIFTRAQNLIFRLRSDPVFCSSFLLFVTSFAIVFRGEFVGAFVDACFKLVIPIFLYFLLRLIISNAKFKS